MTLTIQSPKALTCNFCKMEITNLKRERSGFHQDCLFSFSSILISHWAFVYMYMESKNRDDMANLGKHLHIIVKLLQKRFDRVFSQKGPFLICNLVKV